MANESIPTRGGKGGYEPAARIHERRRRVWEMSVQGFSQGEIARQLGITQSGVSRILRKLLEEEREGFLRQRQLARSVALYRLNNMYREAIEAYERSKAPRTTRRRRQSVRNNVTVADVTEVVVVEREGDPRHLARAHAAEAQIRRLLDDEDLREGTPSVVPEQEFQLQLHELTDAELEQLVALGRKVTGKKAS